MKRWRDEENFFWSEHVSSQIWCYLKLVRWRDEEWDEEMKRWKKKFLGPNMYQAKSGVENFSLYWGVRKSYIQADRQTDKHTYRHTYGHHSDQISRSARERRSSCHTHNEYKEFLSKATTLIVHYPSKHLFNMKKKTHNYIPNNHGFFFKYIIVVSESNFTGWKHTT